MRITPHLFEAFIKCETKCWLRATGESPSGNTYAEWVQTQGESYCDASVKRLMEDECLVSPSAKEMKSGKWLLAVKVAARVPECRLPGHTEKEGANEAEDKPQPKCIVESHIHAVERVPPEAQGKAAQFVPIRFVFTNKLGKDDKLLLAFDAYALSKSLRRTIGLGKIIHGDKRATRKVKVPALAAEVRRCLKKIAEILSSSSPPDLVLNRHCAECEFQGRCRRIAEEKDDLSLLARMSEKERKKLNSKGIFTVTQLSYTFRPRRRPKNVRDKPERYHHSLKALAIRENKIHIVGRPELKIEGTPVYLDVEGLPDRDFYYLIGLRVGNGESAVQHSLWANTEENEGRIWQEFLGILESIENPILIHFGNYETVFFRRMSARYGSPLTESVAEKAIASALNLVSVIFAKIYFPTYTNGLKEIAAGLGFEWESSHASGLQSIVWRLEWEFSDDERFKNTLVRYNAEDCYASAVVTKKLSEIISSVDSNRTIEYANNPKSQATDVGRDLHGSFDDILLLAHSDFDSKKIAFKKERGFPVAKRTSTTKKVIPTKTVRIESRRKCPRCKNPNVKKMKQVSEAIVVDFVFTKNSCRKVVTKYIGHKVRCYRCRQTFSPPRIKGLLKKKYGNGVVALAAYQRIVLRLPFRTIANGFYEMFGLRINHNVVQHFIKPLSEKYVHTQDILLNKMLKGPFIHFDETQVNLQGETHYIWVMTDGDHVVFRSTKNREARWVVELMENYSGVLISDFFAGYDAVSCKQQKCLSHLIRDLNEDLWKEPFNTELEDFAAEFRRLISPIIETIQQYGLKKRHLNKFRKKVESYYHRNIEGRRYSQDVTCKYQKRFCRYKNSLFTFLEEDNIPWNNNMAERALRHLAVQRKISGSFGKEEIHRYLILLGIGQTCLFQDKSFLKFLLSGCKDVDEFK